jgi:hypothetical protein
MREQARRRGEGRGEDVCLAIVGTLACSAPGAPRESINPHPPLRNNCLRRLLWMSISLWLQGEISGQYSRIVPFYVDW